MKLLIALVLILSVLTYSFSYFLNASYIKVVIVFILGLIFLGVIHWGDWLDTDKVERVKEWHILLTLILLLVGLLTLASYFPELEVIGAK